ncbi:hypothetical protein [Tychonema sp. BBK16]|uniref:hypothetical protein n=1 Tax=Tychonema sp. BBK16 TaxID=2699888 RepID=UPI001F39A6BB|nr:hypothetical protein [Tychonema sp. BBK16]MCF6375596.1 hypothetical protein [Tychonema sp. BBK16]
MSPSLCQKRGFSPEYSAPDIASAIDSGCTRMIEETAMPCPYPNTVGTRHCRLLISGNINSDTTESIAFVN